MKKDGLLTMKEAACETEINSIKVENPCKRVFARVLGFYTEGGACYAKRRNKRYKPPDKIIVAGKVKTHAKAILVIVPFCKFLTPFEATIAPATPEDKTWVVETGKP